MPFLLKKIKINKFNKLVYNLYYKNNYVAHIRSLKKTLHYRLILKKVQKVIEFNQELWLKEYIIRNTELKKQAKNDFQKDLLKIMNNSVFAKTAQNVRT